MNWLTLLRLLDIIDRDRVKQATPPINKNIDINSPPKFRDMIHMQCTNCYSPRLYKIGYSESDYTLHCFKCDKIERVVSL